MTNTVAQPIGRIMLKDVRLSFPGLFEATPFEAGGKPKFKATFLIPKDSPQLAEIEKKIKAVFLTKFPKKTEKQLDAIRGNKMRFTLQDGDDTEYDGYAGHMYIGAKADVRPTLLDRNKNNVVESDGVLYAGCYVNASIEIFAYDNAGPGISANLRGVQFSRDGDAFAAGRPASDDEFETVTDGTDAGDFA